MFHMEIQWKRDRDELQQNWVNKITDYVSGGDDIINILSSV